MFVHNIADVVILLISTHDLRFDVKPKRGQAGIPQ